MTIASRSIEIYTTSDGRDFENLLEAARYQAQLDAADGINAFIASREIESEAAANRVRNLIKDWVAFTAEAA